MKEKERLYFGLGIMAYAVAMADGEIQKEERNKIHDIVEKGSHCQDPDIDISEITFRVLERFDGMNSEELFDLAIKELELGKSELKDDMRSDFVAVLEKVARAFPPIEPSEKQLIERFRTEFDKIQA